MTSTHLKESSIYSAFREMQTETASGLYHTRVMTLIKKASKNSGACLQRQHLEAEAWGATQIWGQPGFYYEDPTWKDKIKAKTKMTTSDGNSVRKEEPLHAPEGVSAGTGRLESSGTKKRKRELPEESASPSWAYTHVFIAALVTTARKLEQA